MYWLYNLHLTNVSFSVIVLVPVLLFLNFNETLTIIGGDISDIIVNIVQFLHTVFFWVVVYGGEGVAEFCTGWSYHDLSLSEVANIK